MTKKESNNSKKTLLTELKTLIKDIDEEGLLFLIEQANILRYNLTVDKVNKQASSTKKTTSKTKTSKSGRSAVKIIMDDDKKNFILQVNSQRKFLTRSEFVEMVKISHTASLSASSIKLYQWLNMERRDVIIDCNINSNTSPILKAIVKVIKENYKVKR